MSTFMGALFTFQRRGIVEGFFGPLWSMSHRAALFEFGSVRGMNTYLYAPKDDPYHRERWIEPYPAREWNELANLIRYAQKNRIDFVYGFHPGKGLRFSDEAPLGILLSKAERFYKAGVRTFAVLFDDIPSRLEHATERKKFKGSLAQAEGSWIKAILERQPASWRDVEWWICPSYYTEDRLLERMFGAFEANFLERLAQHLPPEIPCFWTGPAVVSKAITLAHVRKISARVRHPLILWDNYPVNDLSMSEEMHIGPLIGRDARLPEAVYGYLNNPLLQEALSFIPLATCFDYANAPAAYEPETSWRKTIIERFGEAALEHWDSIREFCEHTSAKKKSRRVRATREQRRRWIAAQRYARENMQEPWAKELEPWVHAMIDSLR